jgi:hypothetical protein
VKEALFPPLAKIDLPLSAYIRGPRLRAAFKQIEHEQGRGSETIADAPRPAEHVVALTHREAANA